MLQDNARKSFPTDYDAYAPTYSWTRKAVPWVLEPLLRSCRAVPKGASVLEIGCGTGNYICALADDRRDLRHVGFDLSEPMLTEAIRRDSDVVFTIGDASRQFPFLDATFAFAFAVDVIHHIDDLSSCFAEAHRTLLTGGHFAIVTDSESTLRRRSLTAFFPEVLAIELDRYPSLQSLDAAANRAGLLRVSEEEVTGQVDIDQDFLKRLEAKCSSAMRLLQPEAHAAGMMRVRAAGCEGRQWLSCYDVLLYVRS